MKRQFSPSRANQADGLSRRTLYLVDIENMVRSSDLSISDVRRVRARILAAVASRPGDHMVIASSHHNAEAAHFGWAGSVQRLVQSGPNGADVVLLEVVADLAWVAARYERVVVASGDHAFAFAVAGLKEAGCEVLVVRPDAGLSKELRMAAGGDLTMMASPIPDNVIRLFRTRQDVA